jgi:hypothetical protein
LTRLARWLRYAVFGERVRRSPRRRGFYRGPARDESYKAFIRRQPCCCGCRRGPCEAAHVGMDGGMGLKASDYSTAPLWRECHRRYHVVGKLAFERECGIDFDIVTEGLFTEWSAR